MAIVVASKWLQEAHPTLLVDMTRQMDQSCQARRHPSRPMLIKSKAKLQFGWSVLHIEGTCNKTHRIGTDPRRVWHHPS